MIDDDSMTGEYLIDATYSLDRYPTVIETISFKVKVFSLQVPSQVDAQEYQVTTTQLEFSSDLFTY